MSVRNRLIDFQKVIVAREKEWGRNNQGIWNGHVHTATFKMGNQQGSTVQPRELHSVLCGSLDGRGVWGRMDTCICMAESIYCPLETITTLLISYSPVQNKKFKKIFHMQKQAHRSQNLQFTLGTITNRNKQTNKHNAIRTKIIKCLVSVLRPQGESQSKRSFPEQILVLASIKQQKSSKQNNRPLA